MERTYVLGTKFEPIGDQRTGRAGRSTVIGNSSTIPGDLVQRLRELRRLCFRHPTSFYFGQEPWARIDYEALDGVETITVEGNAYIADVNGDGMQRARIVPYGFAWHPDTPVDVYRAIIEIPASNKISIFSFAALDDAEPEWQFAKALHALLQNGSPLDNNGRFALRPNATYPRKEDVFDVKVKKEGITVSDAQGNLAVMVRHTPDFSTVYEFELPACHVLAGALHGEYLEVVRIAPE